MIFAAVGVSSLGLANEDLIQPLDSYPKASRVWLGATVGKVQVNPSTPIEYSRPGEIVWEVENNAELVEDQVIAVTGYEKVVLSEEQLALKENRRSHEVTDIEWATDEQIRNLRQGLGEQQEALDQLTLTGTERQLLGENFETRLADERKLLSEQIAKLQGRLDSGYFEELEKLDIEAVDLELKTARQEHDELVRTSEVKSPTAGRLEILFRGIISKNTVIAEVVKEGLAEAEVELSDPRLRSIAGEELVADIVGDDGRTYAAKYLKEAEQQSFNQSARTVVFEVEDPEGENVSPALDGSRLLTIYRKMEEQGYLVPKSPLVFAFPDEIGQIGWAGFVEKHWPGSRIIYLGPKEILISKSEN